MRSIICLLLSATLLISCKKEAFVHPEYIVFGAIQGNCANGCRFVYYLDETSLKQDPTVKYFSTSDLSAFSNTLAGDKFLLAKDLLKMVPVELTKTNRTLFVDLNASNPNLWYAEIKLKGRTFTWTFDNSPGSTPSYLKPLADEVIRVSASLQ